MQPRQPNRPALPSTLPASPAVPPPTSPSADTAPAPTEQPSTSQRSVDGLQPAARASESSKAKAQRLEEAAKRKWAACGGALVCACIKVSAVQSRTGIGSSQRFSGANSAVVKKASLLQPASCCGVRGEAWALWDMCVRMHASSISNSNQAFVICWSVPD
eukprot:scaffold101299_cov22-Tisochrysis_lutea.AAC.1